MYDFAGLKLTIEKNRFENQQTSYPFIVARKDGTKIISWFVYDVSGPDMNHLFVHIKKIYTADENLSVRKKDVLLDVPFVPTGSSISLDYDKYLQNLESLYKDFTDERMNHLLQSNGYKPLFNAYQSVKNYIRAYDM